MHRGFKSSRGCGDAVGCGRRLSAGGDRQLAGVAGGAPPGAEPVSDVSSGG